MNITHLQSISVSKYKIIQHLHTPFAFSIFMNSYFSLSQLNNEINVILQFTPIYAARLKADELFH